MDESKLDENRIGRKQDWTKKVGRKQVGRKLGARPLGMMMFSFSVWPLVKIIKTFLGSTINIFVYSFFWRENSHQLSERLASLGIMEAQLRAPLKPPQCHSAAMVRVVSGEPSIFLYDANRDVCRTAMHCWYFSSLIYNIRKFIAWIITFSSLSYFICGKLYMTICIILYIYTCTIIHIQIELYISYSLICDFFRQK